MEKLYTPVEVQQKLGITSSTLYGWHYRRVNLQPKKIGGSLRYTKSDLERFIEGTYGGKNSDGNGEGKL